MQDRLPAGPDKAASPAGLCLRDWRHPRCAWWLGLSRRNRRKREIRPVLPCACRLPLTPLPSRRRTALSGCRRFLPPPTRSRCGKACNGAYSRKSRERTETHKLVAQSTDATPNLSLPNGNFVVHAALGLAAATKRIAINGTVLNETLVLNAGGLRIAGQLGDTPINPAKLSISIYVPERGNPEAKLVVAHAKSEDTVGLPEGNYHVVSTLLDAAANSAASPTNSVISADLKVQAGKLTDATLRHRAATMILKLVNSPGGEALANTAFTILTPGGDVIREMIGAFPSATLAEGEYVAIARHDSKTYQTTFKVVSGVDKDVEFLAKETPPPEAP